MSRRARAAIAWTAACAVLAGVFALYLQPAMAVAITDMVWACFN